MKSLILINFLCIGLLLFSPAQAEKLIQLDDIPDYPKYLTHAQHRFRVPRPGMPFGGFPAVLANIDDDPQLELIRSKPKYVECKDYDENSFTLHWQFNPDQEFICKDPARASFSISQPMDLGKNKPLIFVSGRLPDGSKVRFWVVDPLLGVALTSFDMPGGIDRNNDGQWNGSYSPVGALDVPLGNKTRRAVILCGKSGFDLDGRGIFAVDPFTGEVLWSFETGSAILYTNVQVLDIDGDGHREIIASSLAPGNMGDTTINGFGDNKPYLYVWNPDGSLRWYKELDHEHASAQLQIGDIDADGQLAIAIASNCTYSARSKIVIFDSSGLEIATREFDHNIQNFGLLKNPDKPGMDLIISNINSLLYRLSLQDNQLVTQLKATSKNGTNFLGIVNLPGDAGQGLVVQDFNGLGKILDLQFNIVAKYQDTTPVVNRTLIIPSVEDNPSFILSGSEVGRINLEPNPEATFFASIKRTFTRPQGFLLAGLFLGLVFAWFLFRFKLRRNSSAKKELPETTNDPLHLKERRLHLLEDLEVSNHGAMAPLRSLRRLLWILDAIHSGIAVSPNLVPRLQEIHQDCHEDALPRLINILERARLAKISEPQVADALASLNRVVVLLNLLVKNRFSPETVTANLEKLHKESRTLETILQGLRKQVSENFKSSLIEVLDKVLRANVDEIDQAKVSVHKGMVATMEAGSSDSAVPVEDVYCRMDPDELGFILDNLVQGACRSMNGAPERKLRITWQPVNGLVNILVADTGLGIDVEDHDRIMEPGFSTRPGGGLGLPKSLRLLRKYGGHLHVKSSNPGKGTTFALTVPIF